MAFYLNRKQVKNIIVANDSEIGPKARTVLKKVARDELIKMFKPLNDELRAMENDSEKIAQDLEKRKSNAELTKQTQEIMGAEKEKMLLEQKEKDLLLKQQFSQFSDK